MRDRKLLSLKNIIPFFLSGIAIVVVLIALTGVGKIIEIMSQINPAIYALAFVIQTTALLTLLIKWKIITLALDLRVRTRRMFPILLSGVFVNTAVPSARIGGEPVRAYAFSRIGNVPLDKSFATIAADRALDTIPFVGMISVALGIILFTWHLPTYPLILLTLAVLAAITVLMTFIYVCLKPRVAKRLANWVIERFGGVIKRFRPVKQLELKAITFAENFSRGVSLILHKKRCVVPAFTLAILFWSQFILRMYVVFLALGQPISLGAVGIATALGLLLHIVPIPGGLGAVEGAYALIFKAAGVPGDVAVAAALLDRCVSFWYTALIGVFGVYWTGLKLVRN